MDGNGGTITNPGSLNTSVTGLKPGSYTYQLRVTDNQGITTVDNVVINVIAPPENKYRKVQAEAFSNKSSGTPLIETSYLDEGPDYGLGFLSAGAWMEYNLIGLIPGTYSLYLRYISPFGNPSAQVTVGGTNYTVNLPSNGDNWTTSNKIDVSLGESSTIRIQSMGDQWNFNYFELALVNGGAPANQNPTANAGNDQTITLPTNTASLNGSGNDPDGSISSYAWTQISGPSSAGISSPSQSSTTVNNLVQGVYQFQLRVTDNLGATGTDVVQVTVNAAAPANQNPTANAGNDQTITLPTNTASLNGSGSDPDGSISSYAWTQISGPSSAGISSATQGSTTINNLVQGVYQFQLRVTDNLGATGTDVVQVTVNAGDPVPPVGSRIEAENYTNMSGVANENTSDAGGGQNVGYIDFGDWMDYSVNVSSAGSYAINLRVASPSGGQLQIKDGSGSVLATVSIPNTGGYQSWQTVSANISLAAGVQTIRVQSTSNGWNFNWLEMQQVEQHHQIQV